MSPKALSVGIRLPTSSPRSVPLDIDGIGAIAEWAENAGFDDLWVSDHLYHPYQFLESIVTLSYVAARTRRIGLGPCVYLLPLRSVGVAANQIATLASLSKGRLKLGLGVGGEWPKEWASCGVPVSERGARLDEAVPLLRKLFAGEEVEFTGRFNTFPGVRLHPSPPPIPIYFAGRVPRALERAALHGDGWYGFFLTLEGFKRDVARIAAIRDQANLGDNPYVYGTQLCVNIEDRNDGAALRAAQALNAGYPPGVALTPPEVTQKFMVAGTPDRVLERLREFISAGCESFCLTPVCDGPQVTEQLRIIASEILPKLRPTADHS